MRFRFANILIAALTTVTFVPESVVADDTDPYSLILIAADLQDAKKMMTIFDPNEDGFIDKAEQEKLSWKDDVPKFDLNRDGKITHMEIAIRQASRRGDNDVTQFDRNNTKRFMTRHDLNGNGQLEHHEAQSGGWPPDFKDFDKDGNAVITIAEMEVMFAFKRRMRREMGIEAVDMTESNRIKQAYDKDGDHALAPDEWINAPLPREPKDFDENGDGLLQQIEVATMLAKHRRELGLTKADQAKARQIIRLGDTNDDGVVTKEEMESRSVATASGEFDWTVWDKNQDGKVELNEIEMLLASKRSKLGYSGTHMQQATRLLTRHDTNRTKYVEEHETFENPTKGQLDRSLFSEIDLNKDSRIGLDELARHLAAEEK